MTDISAVSDYNSLIFYRRIFEILISGKPENWPVTGRSWAMPP